MTVADRSGDNDLDLDVEDDAGDEHGGKDERQKGRKASSAKRGRSAKKVKKKLGDERVRPEKE